MFKLYLRKSTLNSSFSEGMRRWVWESETGQSSTRMLG